MPQQNPTPSGEPAPRAPAEAPTTAYEYPAGDRGAHAAAHEAQQRAVEAGPSRDDAAGGEPRAAEPESAMAAMPDGPNVAPSAHDHEAAQGIADADALGQQRQTTERPVPASGAGDDGGGEDRESRIRRAAYARAAGRGFVPGGEVDDWLQAEREIDGAP